MNIFFFLRTAIKYFGVGPVLVGRGGSTANQQIFKVSPRSKHAACGLRTSPQIGHVCVSKPVLKRTDPYGARMCALRNP